MPLKVSIHSFSYIKRGIPNDTSGNGGGFVFDCRFIQNPGRQEQYKNKHGKDLEVMEFLDAQLPMQSFLQNIFNIIDPAINNYIAREFDSLFVSFGCTGGQHRSVYAAEQTARHIRANFPEVEVTVTHNEFPGI